MAAGVAVGAVVGLAAVAINHYILNASEQNRIRAAARLLGLNPHELGDAIEAYKQSLGMSPDDNLSWAQILALGAEVKAGIWKGTK